MLNESTVEHDIFARFAALGYTTAEGVALSPDEPPAPRASWEAAILDARLRQRLAAINPGVPAGEIDGIVRMLARPPHPTLVENNRWFHDLLTGGVPVEFRDPATGE